MASMSSLCGSPPSSSIKHSSSTSRTFGPRRRNAVNNSSLALSLVVAASTVGGDNTIFPVAATPTSFLTYPIHFGRRQLSFAKKAVLYVLRAQLLYKQRVECFERFVFCFVHVAPTPGMPERMILSAVIRTLGKLSVRQLKLRIYLTT